MIDTNTIRTLIPQAFTGVELPDLGAKHSGKVRDYFLLDGRRVLVTTDRLSAFDRILTAVPYKGQVLNQLSAFWFEHTQDIVGNHVIDVPDPNVTVAHECEPFPVEVVVRGYISGVTTTALWYRYSLGERHIYGYDFPEGMTKNQALPEPIITPTTKGREGEHDERITCAEVIERGLLDTETWEQVQAAALAVFKRGQEIAQRGRADPGRHQVRVWPRARWAGRADRRGAHPRQQPLLGGRDATRRASARAKSRRTLTKSSCACGTPSAATAAMASRPRRRRS